MCGEIFTSNHSLKGHMASVHKDKKPSEYNSCSKSFISKQSLSRHTVFSRIVSAETILCPFISEIRVYL